VVRLIRESISQATKSPDQAPALWERFDSLSNAGKRAVIGGIKKAFDREIGESDFDYGLGAADQASNLLCDLVTFSPICAGDSSVLNRVSEVIMSPRFRGGFVARFMNDRFLQQLFVYMSSPSLKARHAASTILRQIVTFHSLAIDPRNNFVGLVAPYFRANLASDDAQLREDAEAVLRHLPETQSTTANAFSDSRRWLKNFPLRLAFALQIPLQEGAHLAAVAVGRLFGVDVKWQTNGALDITGSFFSGLSLDYETASPAVRAFVRFSGPTANLLVGATGIILLDHSLFASIGFAWFLFWAAFFSLNVTLFVSDALLGAFLRRGDFWDGYRDITQTRRKNHSRVKSQFSPMPLNLSGGLRGVRASKEST
jgi:hypothetical protein